MAYTGTLLLLILIFKVGFLITELKSKQNVEVWGKVTAGVCLQILPTGLHKPEEHTNQ
jgi:hypothetical protein